MSELEAIEGALLDALATIRKHWDALLPDAPGAIRPTRSAPKRLYTLPDDDERSSDVPHIDAVASLRHEVTLALNGWSRIVMEDRPVTKALPLGCDTPGLIVFLERHARWMSGHEAAQDAADELRGWAGKVRAVAEPRKRDWLTLGDCPFVVEDWFCSGQIRWFHDEDWLPSCTDCGQEALVDWWMEVLGVVPTVTHEGLVDFIRNEFGKVIKRPTLRKWLERGVIESCGMDAEGRTLFDKGAVAYALQRRERMDA